VGTATFIDPRAPVLVARELGRFLKKSGAANVRDLIAPCTIKQ